MGESCGRVSLWESQTGFRTGLLSTYHSSDLQRIHDCTLSSYGGLRNNHIIPFSEEALAVGGIVRVVLRVLRVLQCLALSSIRMFGIFEEPKTEAVTRISRAV